MIITIVIALIILVIVVSIFAGKGKDLGTATSCEGQGGTCLGNADSCGPEKLKVIATGCKNKEGKGTSGACCIPKSEVGL